MQTFLHTWMRRQRQTETAITTSVMAVVFLCNLGIAASYSSSATEASTLAHSTPRLNSSTVSLGSLRVAFAVLSATLGLCLLVPEAIARPVVPSLISSPSCPAGGWPHTRKHRVGGRRWLCSCRHGEVWDACELGAGGAGAFRLGLAAGGMFAGRCSARSGAIEVCLLVARRRVGQRAVRRRHPEGAHEAYGGGLEASGSLWGRRDSDLAVVA